MVAMYQMKGDGPSDGVSVHAHDSQPFWGL